MRIFTLRKAAVLVLAIGAVGAAHSAGIRPELVPDAGAIKPARMPLSLSKEPVTVVVQLAGDPVSVRQANAGRKLNKLEKDSTKRELKRAQSQLHESINALGAR